MNIEKIFKIKRNSPKRNKKFIVCLYFLLPKKSFDFRILRSSLVIHSFLNGCMDFEANRGPTLCCFYRDFKEKHSVPGVVSAILVNLRHFKLLFVCTIFYVISYIVSSFLEFWKFSDCYSFFDLILKIDSGWEIWLLSTRNKALSRAWAWIFSVKLCS